MVETTSQSVGYSQQTPYNTNSAYAVQAFIVRQIIARLDTMKLVKVMKVTGGGGAIARAGTVDVLPLVNMIDGGGNAVKHGTVYGIPWWRMQGGSNAVICDPKVGDVGYVMCSDRDISNLKAVAAQGTTPEAQVNPGSPGRRYNVADGIYVGGVLNGAPTQFVAFNESGILIRDMHGNVISMSSAGIELTGTVSILGDCNVTGNVQARAGSPSFVTLLSHGHSALNAPPTPGT